MKIRVEDVLTIKGEKYTVIDTILYEGKDYILTNKVINDDDIKTKEDLGESFIDWYEVIDEEDGKDVLADKAYDFTTKIKKNIKLKAVYTGKVETITISFDSRGGSKVNDIVINKGAELELPKNLFWL